MADDESALDVVFRARQSRRIVPHETETAWPGVRLRGSGVGNAFTGVVDA